MKLSIITINYNNKIGLQKTIDSVISQTFKDYEWIIIDGGSTDGSKELIEKYSSYITYWISEPDKGIYNAMNKGIKVAKGEYLQFLNSGDALYSNIIIDELFKYNIYGDIIYGNAIFLKKDKTQFLVTPPKKISLSYFVSGHVINHQSTFIKKELFDNNPYNENFQLVSDWEFEIKQAILGKRYQYIDKVFVWYDYTGLTSQPSDLLSNEQTLVIDNISWAIKNDIDELFNLRKKVENEYVKKIWYYSEKGFIFRKIINLTIHILNLIEFCMNRFRKH